MFGITKIVNVALARQAYPISYTYINLRDYLDILKEEIESKNYIGEFGEIQETPIYLLQSIDPYIDNEVELIINNKGLYIYLDEKKIVLKTRLCHCTYFDGKLKKHLKTLLNY